MGVFNKIVLFNLKQAGRKDNLIDIEPTTEDYFFYLFDLN